MNAERACKYGQNKQSIFSPTLFWTWRQGKPVQSPKSVSLEIYPKSSSLCQEHYLLPASTIFTNSETEHSRHILFSGSLKYSLNLNSSKCKKMLMKAISKLPFSLHFKMLILSANLTQLPWKNVLKTLYMDYMSIRVSQENYYNVLNHCNTSYFKKCT